MPAERHTGIVSKWLNHKGIGFITPEGEESGKNDILVHFGQLKQETQDGFKSLQQGVKVEYELEADPKDAAKSIAVNVTGEDGADCPPKVKRAAQPPREGSSAEEDGEKKSKGKGKRKGKGKGKKGKGKGRKGKGKGKGASEDKEEEEE